MPFPHSSQHQMQLIQTRLRCARPEYLRRALRGQHTGGASFQSSHSPANIAVNRVADNLLLCFCHFSDETSSDLYERCQTDNFECLEAQALDRQLRAFLQIPSAASRAFQLFSLATGAPTLLFAWPPRAVWPLICDRMVERVQGLSVNDLERSEASTTCSRRKIVASVREDPDKNDDAGTTILLPHGTSTAPSVCLCLRVLARTSDVVSAGLLNIWSTGSIMFVCHDIVRRNNLRRTTRTCAGNSQVVYSATSDAYDYVPEAGASGTLTDRNDAPAASPPTFSYTAAGDYRCLYCQTKKTSMWRRGPCRMMICNSYVQHLYSVVDMLITYSGAA